MFESVSVLRGGYKQPGSLFGPLPGIRSGDVLAYEFALPESFVPWPDRTALERVFVLLDLGISLTQPCWQYQQRPDGTRIPGVDAESAHDRAWYVDLVEVTSPGHSEMTVKDLYVDVIVANDGRGHRMLDLDELADGLESGAVTASQVTDGLRRWQAFLDRHLYPERDPRGAWRDFPPKAIEPLAAAPAPLGPIVRWQPEEQ
jgi:hypothetical protein